MINGLDGDKADVVQAAPVPFTVRVTDLPGGHFSLQFYMPTGATVLFADRKLLKDIGEMFITRATGIVMPNEG